MTPHAQLLPGTLDLLILRAVSLGPLHGYGVLLRIGQISGNALLIEQGALYPGLYRLVRQGLLKASWGTSDNNRRAKFYELTAAGRKRLRRKPRTGTGSPPPSARRCRGTGGSMKLFLIAVRALEVRSSKTSCARTSSIAPTTSSARVSRARRPSGAPASSSARTSA